MELSKALRLVKHKGGDRQAYINHACLLTCEKLDEKELMTLVDKIAQEGEMNKEKLYEIIGGIYVE